jgi:hypothetical protein
MEIFKRIIPYILLKFFDWLLCTVCNNLLSIIDLLQISLEKSFICISETWNFTTIINIAVRNTQKQNQNYVDGTNHALVRTE